MGDGMKIAKLGCASGMVLAPSTGQALAAETPASAVFDPTTIVAKGRISTYRHGTYPSEGDLTHAGIDIAAPCASSTVLAWQGGTVADVVSSVDDPNFDSLGYMVLIDHGTIKQAGKRTYSLYLHLNEPPRDVNGNPLLKDGKVERGKKIGVVGATGAAQGCHLHFELRHFAGRFNPVWKNIYGKGDRRTAPEFLSGWSDPQRLVLAAAPAPVVTTAQASAVPAGDGFVTTYTPPKKGLNGVVVLPEPARILPERSDCTREQMAVLDRLAAKRVFCYGTVLVGGSTYIMAQNWLASEADPGRAQVIKDGVAIGSIAASTGGWIVPTLTRSNNFEILSVAAKGGLSKDSLPYLRYRVVGNRLNLIPGRMFADGMSPVDEDRRKLSAATQAATVRQSASPAASQGAAAGQSSAASSNPHCSYAQWSGDVPNIADLFLCDEARAIETFAKGGRFVLKADTVAFSGGKFLVKMNLRPTATTTSINRMQSKFNWDDWIYATQNIASSTVVCAFDSNPVRQGQQAVVSAKLDTYANRTIIMVCSRT